MKKCTLQIARLTFILLLLNPFSLFSQISVVSNNGYAVNIVVLPTAVLPSTTNCPWGYNYNLKINYTVTMTGTNIPSNVYTLQGFIGCGSQSHFFMLPTNGGVGSVNSVSNQWNGASTCNTATVTSLNCNSARIIINGPGIAYQDIGFPITYIALPVNLTSFTANKDGAKIKLSWKTATETNSDHFSIERSADGNTWHELAKVNAAGNSADLISYSWYDDTPLAGNSYYRLKLVDIADHFSFSEVKAVQFISAIGNIGIYPVPNSGKTLNINGISDFSNYRISLFNSSGISVFSGTLTSSSIELSKLNPGIYVVNLQNKITGETHNLRYVQL